MGSRNDHAIPNHLVIRSNPVPGESMIGYLRRLCIANGYDTLQWVFHKNIRFADELFTEENMWEISDVTGCDCKIIRRNSYCINGWHGSSINFHGIKIDRDRIDIKYLNICPDCLLESPIIQSIWDLVDCTACPKHGTNIVNRCPACRRFFSWMRASNTCECGMVEYDDYFTGFSSENEVACAKHISFLLGNKVETEAVPGMTENIKRLSLEDFLYCVNRVYSIPVYEDENNCRVKVEMAFPDKRICVSYSMGILMDWSAPFYNHVEKISKFIIGYGGVHRVKKRAERNFLLASFLGMMGEVASKIDGTTEIFDRKWFDINKSNNLI
ncbi:TniQ family protein [Azospirillum oryzae]|uniref:TniQ family protein n=2 Tax=Azospirillum oryzae TaxID=286727 RepID=A0A6N1AP37_9PROT|nr:TniQ family protein [Azospirillum oryzae]